LRERDEWIQRLALYDASGKRRARWDAPVEVSVALQPAEAAASLRLEAYDPAYQPTALPVPPAAPGGWVTLSLAPGSYRLAARAPGHAEVVLPLWIARGAAPELLRIRLPEAAQVPDGFVYVPAGRSWFGTDNEEQRAPFFDTAPLHQIST